MSAPFLLLQTGRAPPALRARRGDYADWFRRGLGLSRDALQVVDARAAAPLPDARDFAGVVVTGSDSMVTDRAPWSEAAAEWLRLSVAHGVPVLGVCYGHQLLAHALGGRVGWDPAGGELGVVALRRLPAAARDVLCAALPARFPAPSAHRQAVRVAPPGAVALLRSARDPHQALRFAPRAWGVQFHPEFDTAAMAGYLPAHGPRAARAARPTPAAARLLRRFVALAQVPQRAGGRAMLATPH